MCMGGVLVMKNKFCLRAWVTKQYFESCLYARGCLHSIFIGHLKGPFSTLSDLIFGFSSVK